MVWVANSNLPSHGPATPRVLGTPSSQRTVMFSSGVRTPTDLVSSFSARAVNSKPHRCATGCSSLTRMVCFTPGT
jgi:hypothetical protein